MISKKLIKALLSAVSKEREDLVIEELINHISVGYDYNDQKANHILEMLVDSEAIVKEEDVNVKFLDNNLNLLVYKPENYNIKNIKVKKVDNIDCTIHFEYDVIEKINEDNANIDYSSRTSSVSYIEFPDILKKVK